MPACAAWVSIRWMRYGRSPMSSRNSTQPCGGSKAHGVPIDAISCVSVPPASMPVAVPSCSASSCGGVQIARRLARHHHPAERILVVAGRPLRDSAIDHRPVNRVQPVLQVQRQNRRDVAVADQRLARRRISVGIEKRQQLRAAIAAANRDQRRDRRILPGVDESPRTRVSTEPATNRSLSKTDSS